MTREHKRLPHWNKAFGGTTVTFDSDVIRTILRGKSNI